MRVILLLAAALLTGACHAQPAVVTCHDLILHGSADLGFPVVIAIGEEPIVGGGAFPAPAQVGPYEGTIASVVIEQEVDEQGIARFTLIHYFDAREDAFWTEDAAVCTPTADDSAVCDVVTRMTVLGGRGAFVGATGSMHNEGRITFTDPSFQTSPYGSLAFNTTGRVCAPGL